MGRVEDDGTQPWECAKKGLHIKRFTRNYGDIHFAERLLSARSRDDNEAKQACIREYIGKKALRPVIHAEVRSICFIFVAFARLICCM